MSPFSFETCRPASDTVTVTVTVPERFARPVQDSPAKEAIAREARASAPSVPTFFRNVRRRWVAVG